MAAGEMAVLEKSYYKTQGTISYSYPKEEGVQALESTPGCSLRWRLSKSETRR